MKTIEISTKRKNELIDITAHIRKHVSDENIKNGVITIFVPHTTAAVTINENADPDVKTDFINGLDKIIPNIHFKHIEGNSDGHIKSSLVGVSENIIVENSNLVLGTWQGIYFCEFDGPRRRKFIIK